MSCPNELTPGSAGFAEKAKDFIFAMSGMLGLKIVEEPKQPTPDAKQRTLDSWLKPIKLPVDNKNATPQSCQTRNEINTIVANPVTGGNLSSSTLPERTENVNDALVSESVKQTTEVLNADTKSPTKKTKQDSPHKSKRSPVNEKNKTSSVTDNALKSPVKTPKKKETYCSENTNNLTSVVSPDHISESIDISIKSPMKKVKKSYKKRLSRHEKEEHPTVENNSSFLSPETFYKKLPEETVSDHQSKKHNIIQESEPLSVQESCKTSESQLILKTPTVRLSRKLETSVNRKLFSCENVGVSLLKESSSSTEYCNNSNCIDKSSFEVESEKLNSKKKGKKRKEENIENSSSDKKTKVETNSDCSASFQDAESNSPKNMKESEPRSSSQKRKRSSDFESTPKGKKRTYRQGAELNKNSPDGEITEVVHIELSDPNECETNNLSEPECLKQLTSKVTTQRGTKNKKNRNQKTHKITPCVSESDQDNQIAKQKSDVQQKNNSCEILVTNENDNECNPANQNLSNVTSRTRLKSRKQKEQKKDEVFSASEPINDSSQVQNSPGSVPQKKNRNQKTVLSDIEKSDECSSSLNECNSNSRLKFTRKCKKNKLSTVSNSEEDANVTENNPESNSPEKCIQYEICVNETSVSNDSNLREHEDICNSDKAADNASLKLLQVQVNHDISSLEQRNNIQKCSSAVQKKKLKHSLSDDKMAIVESVISSNSSLKKRGKKNSGTLESNQDKLIMNSQRDLLKEKDSHEIIVNSKEIENKPNSLNLTSVTSRTRSKLKKSKQQKEDTDSSVSAPIQNVSESDLEKKSECKKTVTCEFNKSDSSLTECKSKTQSKPKRKVKKNSHKVNLHEKCMQSEVHVEEVFKPNDDDLHSDKNICDLVNVSSESVEENESRKNENYTSDVEQVLTTPKSFTVEIQDDNIEHLTSNDSNHAHDSVMPNSVPLNSKKNVQHENICSTKNSFSPQKLDVESCTTHISGCEKILHLFSAAGLNVKEVHDNMEVQNMLQMAKELGPEAAIIFVEPHIAKDGTLCGPSLLLHRSKSRFLLAKKGKTETVIPDGIIKPCIVSIEKIF